MPRIIATVGMFAVVVGAIGWNIARYPIVWEMATPAHGVARSDGSSSPSESSSEDSMTDDVTMSDRAVNVRPDVAPTAALNNRTRPGTHTPAGNSRDDQWAKGAGQGFPAGAIAPLAGASVDPDTPAAGHVQSAPSYWQQRSPAVDASDGLADRSLPATGVLHPGNRRAAGWSAGWSDGGRDTNTFESTPSEGHESTHREARVSRRMVPVVTEPAGGLATDRTPSAESPVRGYGSASEAFGDAFGPPPSSGPPPTGPIGDRYAPPSDPARSAGARLSTSVSESLSENGDWLPDAVPLAQPRYKMQGACPPFRTDSESMQPDGAHQSHERYRPDTSRELAQAAEPVEQTVTRLPAVDNRWPSTYSEQGPGAGDAAMRYPSTGYAAYDAE